MFERLGLSFKNSFLNSVKKVDIRTPLFDFKNNPKFALIFSGLNKTNSYLILGIFISDFCSIFWIFLPKKSH